MIRDLNIEALQELLVQYDNAINKLEKWGIRIAKNSRIGKYHIELKKMASGYIPKELNELAQLAFIIIEIDEITDIVNSQINNPDDEIRERLIDLQKDTPLRTQNSNPARNSQFELYLKFIIEKKGLNCNLGNPDIIVDTGIGQLEIEAKRPSENGLDANLRKALRQLNPENPGVIAFSLDHLLFGNNRVIKLEKDETSEDGMNYLSDLVSQWANNNKRKILTRIQKKRSACGLFFLIKVPIVSNTLDFITIGYIKRFIPIPYNNKNRADEKLKLLFDRLSKSWININST